MSGTGKLRRFNLDTGKYVTGKRAYYTPDKSKKGKSKQNKGSKREWTNKKLTKGMKTLFDREEPKYYYKTMNNLVVGSTGLVLELTNVPAHSTPGIQSYNGREQDSNQCRIKKITIHGTWSCSSHLQNSEDVEECMVMLVRSRIGAGTGTITGPTIRDIFDGTSTAATDLAPFHGFRWVQDELIDQFNILYKSIVKVQPVYQVTTLPGVPAPSVPSNALSPIKDIGYSHGCNNALIKFPDPNSTAPNNQSYYLILCSGNGTLPANSEGPTFNGTVKVTFADG